MRPFQHLHLIPSADAMGVNGLRSLNVHCIALQIPLDQVTADGRWPHHVDAAGSVVGVYASASRRRSTIRGTSGSEREFGPWQQVSRLGNPLFNEVYALHRLPDGAEAARVTVRGGAVIEIGWPIGAELG